ncbi:MAG: RNA methyltransferase [Aureispira sp.]
MVSKAKIKYIQRLKQKKQRYKEDAFVVEGEKIVLELLQQNLLSIQGLYATPEFIERYSMIVAPFQGITTAVTQQELQQLSLLTTPNQVLAVVKMPKYTPFANKIQTSLHLVLENIQDPGNMGTIIRIADWFGIPHIFCSKGCVDIYNSKVIQASMGSFLRVQVHYLDLEALFQEHPTLPVYGAVLGGNNVFKQTLNKPSFLLIGNEGKGLSSSIQKQITHKITIPKTGGAESLNAGVATGILCALFSTTS